MTWLAGVPEGDTDWDRFATLCPDAFQALAGVVAAAEEETDPVLLELARIRIATLLGHTGELARRNAKARAAGLTEAKVANLPAWPTSPLFTTRERACLSLAEQFVMTLTASPAHRRRHRAPDSWLLRLRRAVSVLETFQRAYHARNRGGAASRESVALDRERAGPPTPPDWRDAAARQHLRRTAYRMRTVDPVTTELVRIRNAASRIVSFEWARSQSTLQQVDEEMLRRSTSTRPRPVSCSAALRGRRSICRSPRWRAGGVGRTPPTQVVETRVQAQGFQQRQGPSHAGLGLGEVRIFTM
jgi:hypothetical protein